MGEDPGVLPERTALGQGGGHKTSVSRVRVSPRPDKCGMDLKAEIPLLGFLKMKDHKAAQVNHRE